MHRPTYIVPLRSTIAAELQQANRKDDEFSSECDSHNTEIRDELHTAYRGDCLDP